LAATASGVGTGVSETSLAEMIFEVSADADGIPGDPGDVDCPDTCKARNFFRCISQA
jgi:hypothetical protein